jgi:UDP-3-O-[3-hydroxymyristoyl] glucosamine N-acyltransferase
MKMTVAQLAQKIDAELVGDGTPQIDAVGPVKAASETQVTFIKDANRYGKRADARHTTQLDKSKAVAVIVSTRIEGLTKTQLIVKNVDAALIMALKILAPPLKTPVPGIDPTAKLAQDVKIGKGVAIGPCVVIDDRVEIGANSIIASGCKIGENSRIGENCRLDSNVVVYHNCIIGHNVVIQANSTIGSTGFGPQRRRRDRRLR